MKEVSNAARLDKVAIDEVTAAFYGAFSNRGGSPAEIDCLYRICIPQAIIIQNSAAAPEIYDLRTFVEPRRVLLSSGSLVGFSEEEVSERTEVFGNIAQRFSRYQKSWTSSGAAFAGQGAKAIQFVRTSAGWRIASLAWVDE